MYAEYLPLLESIKLVCVKAVAHGSEKNLFSPADQMLFGPMVNYGDFFLKNIFGLTDHTALLQDAK